MRLMTRFRRALAALGLARHDEMEQRFSEEMQFHIDMYIERAERGGMSPAEARRAAVVAFGREPAARDEARDAWGSARVHELRQDVRFALRALRRTPGFTTAAVLILAIGLGATTVIFSVVDNVLLRPLPYPDAHRLVMVRESIRELADRYPTMSANASHYLEWKQGCSLCTDVAAMRLQPTVLTDGGEPMELTAIRASANLLPMLAIRPAIGRLYSVAEDEAGDRVVMLGYGFWRARFGGDRGIIGRTISLSGRPSTVIGVLPPDMIFPQGHELGSLRPYPADADLFVPLSLTPRERTTPGEYDYAVIARLADGAGLPQAQAQLQSLQRSVAARLSPGIGTLSAIVTPLQEQMVGSSRKPLALMLAAGIGVLLIVCTNLANLLVARNVERRREAAVRIALGAGRGRLVRQALTESIVLAVLGGALGIAVAYIGASSLVRLAPAGVPRIDEVRVDARILFVCLATTLAVGVGFGLLPALRFGRADASEMMRGATRGGTAGRQHTRSRNLLVGAQVAISTVLLVATGLLVASFVRLLGVDRGFSADQVLAVDVVLPRASYDSASRRTAFFDAAVQRLRALPGVTATAATTALPLEGDTQVDLLSFENDQRKVAERPTANILKVTPGYASTLGIRLLRGRMFTEADRGRPVVVLSERAARSMWPTGDAVGKRIVPGSNDPVAEVIGVVADVRTGKLEAEGSAVAYLPHWQGTPQRATLLARTSEDAAGLTAAVRAAVRDIGPAVPIAKVRTIEAVLDAATAQRRFQLLLIGFFGLVALVTASVGIYAMIAYSLSRRTREIAIRMALGARGSNIRRLAIREGMTPVMGGLVLGAAASVVATRGVASMLYGVRPGDPVTTAAVALVILVLGTLACWIPARRAVTGGIAAALRSE
jgi:putative ABC transport system permease protein